jgi:hypothetical protein
MIKHKTYVLLHYNVRFAKRYLCSLSPHHMCMFAFIAVWLEATPAREFQVYSGCMSVGLLTRLMRLQVRRGGGGEGEGG